MAGPPLGTRNNNPVIDPGTNARIMHTARTHLGREAPVRRPSFPRKPQKRSLLELGGARRVEPAAEKPVMIATTWISQFSTAKSALGCFDAAVEMAVQGLPKGKAALIGNTDEGRINVSRRPDAKGHIVADEAKAVEAIQYIDSMLDRNRRVVVGVSYPAEYAAEEPIGTHHYLTIIGRVYEDVEADRYLPGGSAGRSRRVAYFFYDPGHFNQADDNGSVGKLYIDDDTGIVFKPGVEKAGAPMRSLFYEVTHVRRYRL